MTEKKKERKKEKKNQPTPTTEIRGQAVEYTGSKKTDTTIFVDGKVKAKGKKGVEGERKKEGEEKGRDGGKAFCGCFHAIP